MPNWCMNHLTMTHTDTATADALYDALNTVPPVDGAPLPGLLGTFVPEPAGLTAENWDWYNWRVEHWGTKWEVDIQPGTTTRNGNTLTVAFDSAWCAPLPVYEAMEQQGWTVLAYYWEPGMAFGGRWEDGEDTYIEYYNVSELTEALPGIDDTMGVTDIVAEWDQDEDEAEAEAEHAAFLDALAPEHESAERAEVARLEAAQARDDADEAGNRADDGIDTPPPTI